MKPLRSTREWIGATTVAAVVASGAVAGCASRSSVSATSISPATSVSSATATSASASATAAGSTAPSAPSTSSRHDTAAQDPHQAAAEGEVAQILGSFQSPPDTAPVRQPDSVPAALAGPPERTAAQTVVTSVAWYTTSQTPDEVLNWVKAHPPAGATLSGSGSGSSGPSFVTFSYPTPQSSLIVTPASGTDGRTVIRLDASVIWTPSRTPDTGLGYTASSVTVVTVNSLNPHNTLPARETAPVTATAPLEVHHVVDLLNALQPPIPASRNCAMDDGTRVRITLPGLATVIANPGGCGEVTVTPANGAAQTYAGGPDLVMQVYGLFGITWSRTGDLPPGIERTGASGLQ